MSRLHIQILLLAALGLIAALPVSAQPTISLGSCGGMWSQGQWVGSCTWSPVAFQDNFTFYVNATCYQGCTAWGIRTPNIEVSVGPCEAPVKLTFRGEAYKFPDRP